MCGICDIRLEWDKKDNLEKHIKTDSHLKNKEKVKKAQERGEALKRQATMQGMFDRQKKAKIEKAEFIQDTVKMCMKSNIPLEKMDHPAVRAYLQKYVEGSGDLPCADTLRRDHLSATGLAMQDKIRIDLEGKNVVVVADETSDCRGRCVFAVLLRTVTATATQSVYLASCCFLDTANGTTCSQAILEALNTYSILPSNVVGLVSDSARYMGTCFTGLQIVLGEHLIHYQCWAHKVNLAGDIFMHELKDVNSLVTRVKMAFLHGRKIKSAYINFLKNNFPHLVAKLFPSPVITRWNSWFRSVVYIDEYIEPLQQFLESWEPKNASVQAVCEMLTEKNLVVLKIKSKFVSESCVKIISLITVLEGSTYPYAHLLWDDLTDLADELKRFSTGAFPRKTIELLQEQNNAIIKASVTSEMKACAMKSLLKLTSHMHPCPANDFYKEAHLLLNPAKAGQRTEINRNLALVSKRKLSTFCKLDDETFLEGYGYFHRQLITEIKEGTKIDIVQLLLAVSIPKPEFGEAALQTVWAPVSSVDAERFLSSYNLVLTDRRTGLKEKNLEFCSMLKFNQ